MKLVCSPHYTAGGLICDILNSTVSKIGTHGGIGSIHHALAKIGDNDSVYDNYQPDDFYKRINEIDPQYNDVFIGTHCWPGPLDLSRFDTVINLTTVTYRSRMFRWARAYTLYFQDRGVNDLFGIDKIDKMRSLAKNYIKPFLPVSGSNVINLEFSSIVDYDTVARNILGNSERYAVWKKINSFLYDLDFWNSDIAQRFHEAEYEIATGIDYVYQ